MEVTLSGELDTDAIADEVLDRIDLDDIARDVGRYHIDTDDIADRVVGSLDYSDIASEVVGYLDTDALADDVTAVLVSRESTYDALAEAIADRVYDRVAEKLAAALRPIETEAEPVPTTEPVADAPSYCFT